MPKKYDVEFKKDAVTHLLNVSDKGFTIYDGIKISNVRDLCESLDVSSSTLYGWSKKIKPYPNDALDLDLFEPNEADVKELEAHVLDDEIDDIINEKVESFMVDFINDAFGSGKDIKFGTAFFQWFARNYLENSDYRESIGQLKLKLGIQLIKESGLVDVDEIYSKFKI